VQALGRTSVAVGRADALSRAALLLTGLTVGAVLRGLLNGHTPTSALLAGAGFGSLLTALAVLGGWRPRRPSVRAIGSGLGGGVVLLFLPRLLGAGPHIHLGSVPEPFAAWVLATLVVATAEEVLLRGALLDALTEGAGFWVAILGTSAAFALMHVPLYGWGVVPLDFGVGFWFAGLRLTGGGVAAPTIAHVIADLSTWWLG
jgi:membrane protease YdiL (CAAX protease family)